MAKNGPQNLTAREQQILSLIAEGHESREIARRLEIAYFTVRKHRANITAKLGINAAPKLAAHAVSQFSARASMDPNSSWRGPP